MTNLKELLEGDPEESGLSVHDFDIEEEGSGNTVSPTKSINNLAAHSVALGKPADVIGQFRSVANEMSTQGQSRTGDGLLETAKNNHITKSREALVELLSDPTVSFEEKQEIAQRFSDDIPNMFTERDMLSADSIAADSSVDESDEEEFVRVDTANVIQEVNQYKRQVQSVINREALKSNPDLLSKTGDILELFVPLFEGATFGGIVSQVRGGDKTAYTKALTMLGESKIEVRDYLRSLPIEKRESMIEGLIEIVNSSDTIIFPDKNDFNRMDYLRTILEDGYYDNVDRWVDNAFSVLDTIFLGATGLKGLGTVVRKVRKGSKVAPEAPVTADPPTQPQTYRVTPKTGPGAGQTYTVRLKDLESDARRQSVQNKVQPTSVSQNFKDTNPEKARTAHELAAMDNTNEASRALYGTNRTEAIANDLLGDIGKFGGIVRNKVSDADRAHKAEITPAPEVMDFVTDKGHIYYWESEKRKFITDKVRDFRSAMGGYVRNELFQVRHLDDGFEVTAFHGPREGGFRNAASAVETTKFQLRRFGVTEKDLTLFKKEGDIYVPIKFAEDLPESDYMVGIKHRVSMEASDVEKFEKADVKRNQLDMFSFFNNKRSGGSVQRHIFDAASMFHPNITLGANVAVDKAVGLEKTLADLGKTFSKKYQSLSWDRRLKVEDYIVDANDRGISLDKANLKAKGFTDNEIGMLKDWKETWDTIYWLENADYGKSLRTRGFELYVNPSSDTRLFARPIARNKVGSIDTVFDSEQNKVRKLSLKERKELYDNDGTLARLRQPMDVDGTAVETILIPGNSKSNYLRRIRDDDTVLNYRQGYYQVHYDNPRFIVERVKGKGGQVYERAVGTAGNTKDAELMVSRLKEQSGGDYYQRGDVKKAILDSDDMWDIAVAQGRTAQKVRGKRLEDASGVLNGAERSNMLDPTAALVKSIRSVSRRVVMRDYIDAARGRFLDQFGHLVTRKNDFQQPVFPNSIGDIGQAGVSTNKELADARSTWEYINYIENGYFNAIDDVWKAGLKQIAEIAGAKGVPWLEGGLNALAQRRGPAAFGKSAAFQAYLALNPLRQAIVQSHQMIQLAPMFPRYMAKMPFEISAMIMGMRGINPGKLLKATGMNEAEFAEAVKQFRKSGLASAVDANNLVRSDLMELADLSFGKKAVRPIKQAAAMSQKAGFDAGEITNIMSAWLAHRDKIIGGLKAQGKKPTAADWEQVAGQARNFTYNMNFAGDVAYNQNFLNLFGQFLQVPHKAVTQMLTNRVLTRTERAKMTAWNLAMYGAVPAGGLEALGITDFLPDDPQARELMTRGWESVMLNWAAGLMSEGDTQIDWSGLAPLDVHGMLDTVFTLATDDIGELLSNSPSGQLFFGNNPRITNAFRDMASYFHLNDDYKSVDEFTDVLHSFASIASGYSNAYKARYALRAAEKINSMGDTTDPDATTPEAIAQLFGFPTMKEAQRWYVNNEVYERKKEHRDDVRETYRHIKRTLDMVGKERSGPEAFKFMGKVMGEAWRAFPNDAEARKQIAQLIRRDIRKGDGTLFKNLLGMAKWDDIGSLRDLVRKSNLPDEQKQKAQEAMDFIEKNSVNIEPEDNDG